MAGIYIHIPFCRQACHYCDFHFSTNLSTQAEMVDAICKEVDERSEYFNEEIRTIYFGGGTPSLLTKNQLKKIFAVVKNSFKIVPDHEVTLEANPEDLTFGKLEDLLDVGINRLSIGLQTFSDEHLKWMNRIHSSKDAISAYKDSRQAGFENISLDLIYAISESGWEGDLETATELKPEHISLYGLTIEENTVFGKWRKNNKLIEVSEEYAAEQYLNSIAVFKAKGYEQYEVSSFCKSGFESKHNSSYWAGEKYLGIGPGAHSYNGSSRQFNIRNNAKYLDAINDGHVCYESEQLSKVQLMNERILTQLRTVHGLDVRKFKDDFDFDLLKINKNLVEQLFKHDTVFVDEHRLSLTAKGFLVADEIALKLFFNE